MKCRRDEWGKRGPGRWAKQLWVSLKCSANNVSKTKEVITPHLNKDKILIQRNTSAYPSTMLSEKHQLLTVSITPEKNNNTLMLAPKYVAFYCRPPPWRWSRTWNYYFLLVTVQFLMMVNIMVLGGAANWLLDPLWNSGLGLGVRAESYGLGLGEQCIYSESLSHMLNPSPPPTWHDTGEKRRGMEEVGVLEGCRAERFGVWLGWGISVKVRVAIGWSQDCYQRMTGGQSLGSLEWQ